MAVNETLSGYSITAASNTPVGTDNVGPDLDNHLRDIKKNIRIAFEHSNSEAVRGRIWNDTSASPVTTLKYSDGTDDITLFSIDESANTVTPFVDGVAMQDVGKAFNKAESTASALDVLTFSAATKHLASASTTATIHERIGVGTAIADLPELITGSATTGPALPAVSGEFLNNLPTATQVQQEAGTATGISRFVTPGLQQHHPSAAKAWLLMDGSGTASVISSYNIASAVRNGTGNYSFEFTIPMSSSNYPFMGGAITTRGSASDPRKVSPLDASASGASFIVSVGTTITDAQYIHIIVYGDQ